MKRILLLSALIIGVVSAAQAGVHVEIGLPLPPLPHVSIRPPVCPPVVVRPPVYYQPPGYYGYGYSHRCYPGCGHGYHRYDRYDRHDRYDHRRYDGHYRRGDHRDRHGRW